MKNSEILETAVEIMDNETVQWCQGTMARSRQGEVYSACAVGILGLAAGVELLQEGQDGLSGESLFCRRSMPDVVADLPDGLMDEVGRHTPERLHRYGHEAIVYLNDDSDIKTGKFLNTKDQVRDVFMMAAKAFRDKGE